MNREDLIVKCRDVVNNLVRKYNNHEEDEDLVSVGMIAVVECVDRSLKDNMTDENQILARCNVWAKNRILNEIYKEKIKYDDDIFADELEAQDDIDYLNLIISVEQDLSEKELKFFTLLKQGKSEDEICEEMNIGDRTYRDYCKKIKDIIAKNSN